MPKRGFPDKIRKNKFLRRDSRLRSHIPVTLRATTHNFNKLLNRYQDVIFKPIHGSGGKNVYRIISLGNSQYLIRHESKRIKVHYRKAVFRYLRIHQRSSRYLVQPCINLVKIKGRPCDIRVITQRKRNSRKWKVTGKAAKVAGRGYIVTNITRSGGALYRVQTALNKTSLPSSAKHSLSSEINKLSLKISRRLNRMYVHQRIFGHDVGVDNSGKIWIIESNRKPALSHFTKLGDYATYRRIKAYKRNLS